MAQVENRVYRLSKEHMRANTFILLVSPWIHDFAAFDYWAKPLGLLHIASVLREEGFDVEIVDCLNDPAARTTEDTARRRYGRGPYRKEEIPKPPVLSWVPRRYSRYGITPDQFRKRLRGARRPDAILVTSGMTYWYPGVFESINIIRETLPGIPIALGGIYATLCPDHARAYSGADVVVEGDVLDRNNKSSIFLKEILATLLGRDIPAFRSRHPSFQIQYPAFDILPSIDQVTLFTSRGCPYSCVYCASRALDGDFRERDPFSVVDEIEYWNNRYGIRDFSFYDDALMVNAERRLVPMLKEILRRNLECRFHCPNGMHLRGMNQTIAGLMYRSGFKTLRFGFETSRPQRQEIMGGKISNQEAEAAVEHLKWAGFRGEEIGFYLLCGLPGQERKEMEDTVEYVASLGVRPVIAEYSPVPRTALWPDALASSPLDLAGEPLYHNNSIFPLLHGEEDRKFLQYLKQKARQYDSRLRSRKA